MGDTSIRIQGLGKRYRLGTVTQAYDTLRDAAMRWFRSAAQSGGKDDRSHLWALREVNLEVERGEVLGIIGSNGAGKSTLLKILSRITSPTEGRVELKGRVGTLLEVGTGFHPELTGRENIFLNGAILGMTRAEIRKKFDEIVDFAGTEKFLDTPVKRYSSGMYVRLAFAVAAHLEPEILMIDEVLAVGDVAFQKKSLGKMGEVARGGRTVLLVSHNLSAIENFCSRVILLNKGQLIFAGGAQEGLRQYIQKVSPKMKGKIDLTEVQRSPGLHPLIRSISMLDSQGKVKSRNAIQTGEDAIFEIEYDCQDFAIDMPQLGITSSLGQRLITVGGHLSKDFNDILKGKGNIRCVLPNVNLNAGEYGVTLMFSSRLPPMNVDYIADVITFSVTTGNYFGTGTSPLETQGPIAQKSQWSVVQ